MDKEAKPKQEADDELEQRMKQWQQAHPEATLTEIEEAVEAELAVVRQRLVERMVKDREAAIQEEPDCPQCGARMVKNGRRQRRLKGVDTGSGKDGKSLRQTRFQFIVPERMDRLLPYTANNLNFSLR